MTVSELIGSSVDQVDDRYRNVADAMVLFQRGNAAATLSMLQDSVKQHPELPPAEVMFAHLCFGSNQLKPGRDILQRGAVVASSDPEVWNMLADLQLREGHLAEAEILFKKGALVAADFQGNPKRRLRQLSNAHAGAALTNEQRGLWREAEPHLLAWQQIAPNNEEIVSRLAVVLMNTARFDEARKMLDQRRAMNPKSAPAEVVIGTAYERLGKHAEAREAMLESVKKYPNDFETRIAVARWGLGSGEIALALESAAAAEALDKTSFLPELIVGQAHYLNGEFAKSEATFQKVYQSKPANFDAVNGLALSILAQEDASRYSMGREYAELLARTNNDLKTVQGRQAATLLAWALHRTGRGADAQRLITGVLSSGPVSAEGAYFAATIYSSQGEKQMAQEAVTKALASSKSFPYHVQAGQLQEALRQTEEKVAR